MKTKTQKTQQRFLAITAWVLLVCTLTFASCDNGGGTGTGTGHTHSYSTTWSFNATQHWKECIANDGAKTGTANHTSNLCTVCGYDSLQNWTAVVDNTIWQYTYNGVTYTNFINAVAYGNGRWVAGGEQGTMAYSDDNGETWTAVADSPFSSAIRAIAYGSDGNAVNKWVAGGDGGTMAYSDDNGETWTTVADSPFSSDIRAIAYGNGRFVAVSYYGKEIAYSDDGESWTVQSSQLYILGIAYGNNRFVAVGWAESMDAKIAYSDDGESWTLVAENTFGMYSIYAIAYGNGKFVAGSWSYGRMAYSANGETWTAVTDSTFPSGSTGIIYAIAYGGGRFADSVDPAKMVYANW